MAAPAFGLVFVSADGRAKSAKQVAEKDTTAIPPSLSFLPDEYV